MTLIWTWIIIVEDDVILPGECMSQRHPLDLPPGCLMRLSNMSIQRDSSPHNWCGGGGKISAALISVAGFVVAGITPLHSTSYVYMH